MGLRLLQTNELIRYPKISYCMNKVWLEHGIKRTITYNINHRTSLLPSRKHKQFSYRDTKDHHYSIVLTKWIKKKKLKINKSMAEN